MMLAGQPRQDELGAERARLDLQARREPTMRFTATAAGEARGEPFDWTDRATSIPGVPPARSGEIRIDQSDRLPVETGFRADQRPRGVRIMVALAAASAVALAGTVGGYRLFHRAHDPSPLGLQGPSSSGGIPTSAKGDRLEVRTITRQSDRDAAAKPPQSAAPRVSPATSHPKPAAAGDRLATARPHTVSISANAEKRPVEAPPTPVPETRPTTIDGWTLHDVVNGTAVLEGPNGVVRVKRGDTVPGVGKVVAILRWGNRLIVATSRGLISTP